MDQPMNQPMTGGQAQLGPQTVGVMNNPPAVITDKDLSYLKDALSWELLALKKCHHYTGLCQDQEISAFLGKVTKMHQDHYLRLLNEVNSGKTLY